MSHEGFTPQHRAIGRAAAWAVSFLLVVYAVTTVLGFLSLKSPPDPIGDPYFSIMELLTVLIAPLLVLGMVAVHAYASPMFCVGEIFMFTNKNEREKSGLLINELEITKKQEKSGVIQLPMIIP